MEPDQTTPRSSLIRVHTVCHRGFLNISADEKSRQLLLRLTDTGLTFSPFLYPSDCLGRFSSQFISTQCIHMFDSTWIIVTERKERYNRLQSNTRWFCVSERYNRPQSSTRWFCERNNRLQSSTRSFCERYNRPQTSTRRCFCERNNRLQSSTRWFCERNNRLQSSTRWFCERNNRLQNSTRRWFCERYSRLQTSARWF